ncbi:fad binding domain protein [Moniliophthora roreri MCA 2997]|uniref:Fad binding domain protein n=1 Tax=Moniliophthora roreri (strain MCA 2997) TaxID=1381753 RepID=V2XHW7_MONRO|nr:fad binding domain protein [Moniliophthora roreri MCA 2997]
MHFTAILLSVLPFLSNSFASGVPNILVARQSNPNQLNNTRSSTPSISLTHLFDVRLQLGALGSDFTETVTSWNTSWYWSELMIRSDGDLKLAVPIVNGTVTGSAVNGTVHGGVAFVYVDEDSAIPPNTTSWSYGTVWGTTSDGTPFVVQESGEGTNTRHIATLDVDIGGNYTKLSNTFILAEVLLNATSTSANTTAISVKAYRAW